MKVGKGTCLTGTRRTRVGEAISEAAQRQRAYLHTVRDAAIHSRSAVQRHREKTIPSTHAISSAIDAYRAGNIDGVTTLLKPKPRKIRRARWPVVVVQGHNLRARQLQLGNRIRRQQPNADHNARIATQEESKTNNRKPCLRTISQTFLGPLQDNIISRLRAKIYLACHINNRTK